jgi:hypothetical protein
MAGDLHDICVVCGDTWEAHEQRARARLRADFPGLFDTAGWDTDDRRIEQQMIADEMKREHP